MTDLDFDAIKQGLSAAVPFVRTLGLEYLELSAEHAVLRLPDEPAFHNHVGGPHAGAIFTLAESASGAVVIGSFSDLLGTVTPLAASAEIAYRKLAKGDGGGPARATGGGRTTGAGRDGHDRAVPGRVVVRTEDGTQTAQMTVSWALRPNRT